MAITGKAGSVKIGSVVVTQFSGWKVDLSGDTKDVTNFQSNGWKEQIQGIKSWSGSCDGTWNVSTDTTGQQAIQNALLNGTIISLVLGLQGTNTYTGNALIKKVSLDEAVDGSLSFPLIMKEPLHSHSHKIIGRINFLLFLD
jgi:predicted secreted protein